MKLHSLNTVWVIDSEIFCFIAFEDVSSETNLNFVQLEAAFRESQVNHSKRAAAMCSLFYDPSRHIKKFQLFNKIVFLSMWRARKSLKYVISPLIGAKVFYKRILGKL